MRKGSSQKSISQNIATLVNEGYPDGHGQAGAIAMKKAGKTRKMPIHKKTNPIYQGTYQDNNAGMSPTGMPFLRKQGFVKPK